MELGTKWKVLEALKNKIHGHINVQIQFNFDSVKKYCEKPTHAYIFRPNIQAKYISMSGI